jgi:outer membrane protein assembly factor BamB
MPCFRAFYVAIHVACAAVVDTVTIASAKTPWGWTHRGYNARHSDYAPDLPPLPNSCYGRAPPVSVPTWQNNQPFSTVASAPLLVYPPFSAASPPVVFRRGQPLPLSIDGLYIFAGNDTYVRAITASGGRFVWAFQTDGVVSAPLGYDPSRQFVFVGSQAGTLFALRASNGTVVWLANGLSGGVTKAGVVYSNFTDLVFAGSWGGYINAFDAGTGRVMWTYFLPYPAVETTPVVSLDGSSIFVAAHTGRDDPTNWMKGLVARLLTSRIPVSPRLLWMAYLTPQGQNFGQIMPKLVLSADGTRLYATSRSLLRYMGSTVFALNTEVVPNNATSQILWFWRSPPSPFLMVNSPSVMDGEGIPPEYEVLVVAAETSNPDCCDYEFARLIVRAYSALTGAILWEFVDAAHASWSETVLDISPVIAGPPGAAVVYVPTRYGWIWALSMADGSPVWSQALGDDNGVYFLYRLGVTAPIVLTPSGALITVNAPPRNQIRIWGNTTFPVFVDRNSSLVSCAAIGGASSPAPTSGASAPTFERALAVIAIAAGLHSLLTALMPQ